MTDPTDRPEELDPNADTCMHGGPFAADTCMHGGPIDEYDEDDDADFDEDEDDWDDEEDDLDDEEDEE